jgi:hypothetical protein
MKSFSKALGQQLSVDDGEVRIGLMRYSTYADSQFQLRDHTTSDSIVRAVDRVQYRPGSTNTRQALDSVRTSITNFPVVHYRFDPEPLTVPSCS